METPLPLHPRRAQQLFQDVLLTDSELTPHLSEKSLPQRLHLLQGLNLSGIKEAKRGTHFQRVRHATASSPHSELEEVTLVLTKDGSALQITSEHDEIEATSIALLDITGITVQTAPLFSFSLQSDVEDIEDDNNERSGVMTPDTFIAPNADVLTRWVVALTCGINAFQQQHQQQSSKPSSSDGKAAELVWQAVRLRIFELATVIPLPTAIEYVIVTIPQNDLQQCKALRERLQFLRCGGSAA